PTSAGGTQNLAALDAVIASIGQALRQKTEPHTVVVRSTVLPRTTEHRVVPALEQASGRRLGEGLTIRFNPEFWREGAAIKDFFRPPFTIIGGVQAEGCARTEALYGGIEAPIFSTTSSVAESLKYACNAYHAVKIAFANEIGALLKTMGIDGR